MGSFLVHNINQSQLSNDDRIIDLSNNLEVKNFTLNQFISFSIAYLKDEPLLGKKFYENNIWFVGFAGDLLDFKQVPFAYIIENLENEHFDNLKTLNGVFSIIAYNKKINKYYLISDRRSQHPVYYYIKNSTFIFSTELSSFCKLLNDNKFNEKWLYNYLFFNFGIEDITFLENVYSMPAASILVYNQNENTFILKEYSNKFIKKENLLNGEQALEYAKEIFEKRIHANFNNDNKKIAVALSGGWDARTNLALAPNKDLITAYTYGEEGCDDIIAASKTTKKLNLSHKVIDFGEDFINNLPHYILETVYLSSGLQGILRSTLLYVYSRLKELLPDHKLVISGIMMDTMFRGHIGMPALTPIHIMEAFRTGRIDIDRKLWSSIFSSKFESFYDYTLMDFNFLQNKFGNFLSEEFYISYIIYIASKIHFLGEYKIANNFNTMRVTAWDNEIIDLAFSIEFSALKTARKAKENWWSRNEFLLQSYLMSCSLPSLIKIPIKNTRPDIVLKGNFYYKNYNRYSRIINGISKRLFMNKNHGLLENWELWLNHKHVNFINELVFSKEALIREYITDSYLEKIYLEKDLNIIGKLTTIEVILRLIKNKWNRFW